MINEQVKPTQEAILEQVLNPKFQKRFWSKVIKSDACWGWTASTSWGYAQIGITINGRTHMIFAHRIVWMINHGIIPAHLFVLHRCDVRMCSNPDHLFLGTQKNNIDDARSKGRLQHGEDWVKSHHEALPRGQFHWWSKLTDEQVEQIRKIGRTQPQRITAEQFGINRAMVSMIVNNQRRVGGSNWRPSH